MRDNTSQRTEEEMLDQTFVGYDEEMTVQTGGETQSPDSSAVNADKKKSQNMLIIGAMGIAALGFLGFKFLGNNDSAQPAPVQVTQVPEQSTINPTVAVTTEPVQVAVPSPFPIQQAQPNFPPVEQQPFTAPTVDPVAQYTGNTNNAFLPTVVQPEVVPEVVVTVQPPVITQVIKPLEAPVRVESASVAPIVAISNANANAKAEGETLIAKFQDILNREYNPRVSSLEQSMNDQKQLNRTIEDRLERLEAGKPTKVVSSSNSDSQTSNENVVPKVIKKIVRKPVVIKQRVEKTVTTRNTNAKDSEVLIDRNSNRNNIQIERIQPVYPKVEIHSVYSGRVWTKNADGTLSTFAVGDKLPSGETIKKIDEDKILTDKRIISQ